MSLDVKPGTVIERYVVDELIGQGGMAAVYRVTHTQLGTKHALKLITIPSISVRERLIGEGRVQAALQHTNIVNVTDVVTYEGNPGLVMELVRGPNLDQLIDKQQLTIEQIDHVVRGILDGVMAAHARGLIHRDLKPANVMLAATATGFVPKVTDFGIAKVLGDESQATATRTGTTMGTPAYMAPEQMRNAKGVDARADVWSLGAILYEVCTSRRAFPGEDLVDLYAAVAGGKFELPTVHVPELPPRMEAAIVGALVVDRDQRVASVAQLRALWTGEATDVQGNAKGPWDDNLLANYLEGQTGPITAQGPSIVLSVAPAPAAPSVAAASNLSPPSVVVEPPAGGVSTRVLAIAGVAMLLAAVVLIVGVGAVLYTLKGRQPEVVVVAAPVAVPEPTKAPEVVASVAVPPPDVVPPENVVAAPVVKDAPKHVTAVPTAPVEVVAVVGTPDPTPVAVSPPVAVASSTSAHVELTGDARSVWIVGDAGRFALPSAELPAGTYKIQAFFDGVDPVTAGEITVGVGENRTLKCVASLRKCK